MRVMNYNKVYLFYGGLSHHRRRGHKCVLHWKLETSEDCYIVKFLESLEDGSPDIEICDSYQLKEDDNEEK